MINSVREPQFREAFSRCVWLQVTRSGGSVVRSEAFLAKRLVPVDTAHFELPCSRGRIAATPAEPLGNHVGR